MSPFMFFKQREAPSHQRFPKGKHHMKNSAETILEAIVSISILMVIMAPASALYISSTRSLATNRNDLVGSMLAEEGIEIVRNMRDTNLLRFSPKALDCWNARGNDPLVTLENCDAEANAIAAGSYRLEVDVANAAELPWSLERLENNVPLDATFNEYYRLKLDDTDVEKTFLYNHLRGTDTVFFRSVVISYEDADMHAVSRVLYRRGNTAREIRRDIFLTNQPS